MMILAKNFQICELDLLVSHMGISYDIVVYVSVALLCLSVFGNPEIIKMASFLHFVDAT